MNERQRGGRDPGRPGDAWLHAAVRASVSASADGCPDASELAAFAEGRLDRVESERFERHAARCQRCLDVLSALARTDEGVVAAAEQPARGRRAWWRWLVPATVAATAAGVYLLVQPPPPAGNAGADAAAEAPAYEREAPADTRAEDTLADAGAENRPADAGPKNARSGTLGGRGFSPGTPAAPAPQRDAVADAPLPMAAKRAKEAPSKGVAASAESRVQAAPAVDRELAKMEPVPEAPAEAPVLAEARAPLPQATRPRSTAAENLALGATAAAHWLEASAPDGTSRWRFGPGAAVSRSVDGGRTWEPGTTPAGVTAASCPAPTTCWAVGRAGVVLVTADGISWRRAPFADASDLVAVAAESATVATVTTATGARYTTGDGGHTWVALEHE